MKLLTHLFLAFALTLCVAMVLGASAALSFGLVVTLAVLVAHNGMPQFTNKRAVQCGATLTATEILTDTIDAFWQMFPMLKTFSTRFTADRVALGQTLIGHIRTLPVASTYDAAQGGYKNGANDAAALLADVPVVVNQHPHVPLKISHLVNIQSQKDVYQNNINDAAYVLGKSIVDFCLSKVTAANFSHKTTQAVPDTDRDTLGAIRKAMNIAGAGSPRVGIVNSDVYEQLDSDVRIASRDFYGQATGGNPLGRLKAVAGFSDIFEYPPLPGNGENLSGVFFDPRAIVLVAGLPDHNLTLAKSLGLPEVMRSEIITDAETGLSFMGLMWQEQGTADVYMTVTLIYGAAAGKQAGGADTICDQAGHRLVTA